MTARNFDLPRATGTAYEVGTTDAHAAKMQSPGCGLVCHHPECEDVVVVVATFGNEFSETVIPMTYAAAMLLREQLAHALLTARLEGAMS